MTISYEPMRAVLYTPGTQDTVFESGQNYSALQLAVEGARLAYYRAEDSPEQLQRLTSALGQAGFLAPRLFINSVSGSVGFGSHHETAQIALLAFRGTSPDDISDIAHNLQAALVPWPQSDGRVHVSFAREVLGLLPQISQWMQHTRVDPQTLIITGHSLGAAMATLAASVLSPNWLVALGSPRVGDAAFVGTVTAANIQRIVNCCDVVTRLPPPVAGYTHLPTCTYISRAGKVVPDPDAQFVDNDRMHARKEYLTEYAWKRGAVMVRDLADHAPINYIRAFFVDTQDRPIRFGTGVPPTASLEADASSGELGERPSQAPPVLHDFLPVARDSRGHPNGSYYRVWFGTNRRPRNALHPNEGFDSQSDKALHVGSCVVRIPYTHRPGSVGSSLLRRMLVVGADDRVHVESINVVDKDWFIQELKESLADDPKSRALVYIHGYNTTFQDAAIRAAQIGFDLGITGLMTFYSWASHGRLTHYLADGTAIELAEDYFVKFMQLLMSVEGIRHVDILAHSMGNRLLLRTIQILSSLKRTSAPGPRIRHILLAAPDVDIGKFGQLAEHYKSVPEKWTTVYTCRKDLAIAASTWLVDAKRLGYEPPVYSEFGLDTISASLLPLDWLGHGYFAAAKPLLDDMNAIIERDARPASRELLPIGGSPPKYWLLREG